MKQPEKLNIQEEFQLLFKELTKIFSPTNLAKIAKEVGFVQRSSKLKAIDFISLCAFWNHQSSEKSLAQLCAVLDSQRGVSISSEGLNQRFNRTAVQFLKAAFQILFLQKIDVSPIPNAHSIDFYRIRVVDSTAFELPIEYREQYRGYHKSGVKIQLEYELLKGEFLHLEVQNSTDSDMKFNQTLINSIQANDLILKDLGYFFMEDLVQINDRDAYYVMRMKPNMHLYERIDWEYTKIDLESIMDEMEIGEVREIESIYVGQAKKHIPRLILYKLTDEQTDQRLKRRAKQEKKKGVKYSHRTKKLSALNIFITNIPYQCVPKEEIQSIYSLRWQIELLFKTWKSLFQIHKVKKMKVERFECHLYGTLISLLISSTLAFQIRELLYRKKKREISEFKAISIVKEYLPTLEMALYQGSSSLFQILNRLSIQIEKNGRKSHRYKKKTVFDILGVLYERNIAKIA